MPPKRSARVTTSPSTQRSRTARPVRPAGSHRPVLPAARDDRPLQAFRAPSIPRLRAPRPPALLLPAKSAGVTAAEAPPPAGAVSPEAGVAAVNEAPPHRPVLAADMPAGALQVMSWSCAAPDDVGPHALGITYWFAAAPTGDPYPVSMQFTGRRVVGSGAPGEAETFQVVRTVDRVIPGSGRVALTARVPGLAPGEWDVTASPVAPGVSAANMEHSAASSASLPRGSARGATAFQPVVNVRAPGVRIGAWPSLVGIGWLVALVLQSILAAREGLPVGRVLIVSALASLIGLAGAKAYYLLTHRKERPDLLTAGMSIQGFVLAAIGALVLGNWWAEIPLWQTLDVTAPGLLFGMMIGRLGCLFGGCCAGRPTASRWGVWSSDRRVGVRRIPVQLLESGPAGIAGAVTLAAVLVTDSPVEGLIFVAGFAAYTFGRQLLFPLRGIARTTAHGRMATLVVAGLVLVAALARVLLA
jgi:phosphatidylglycerol:prolipoprotein diacylglycerol transferase